MPQHSAGILLYRLAPSGPEVLLLHPGGPFWARKDAGAWSIPKGLVMTGETPSAAARREYKEETGAPPPSGALIPLGDFRYSGGKVVTVFALEGDFDPAGLHSNAFTMEWPPRSGRTAEFPEADRAAWFGLAAAAEKLVSGQRPLVQALADALAPTRA